jgi:hypothetical protein
MQLVKVDILRSASAPQLDRWTNQRDAPLGFIERVVAVQPRVDEADDDTIPVDIELVFVGGGPWKGEIRVARQPAAPEARKKILEELLTHARGL